MKKDSSIKRLLNRIESVHLEHMAPDTPIGILAETICAFLNSGGGTVLLETEPGTNKLEIRKKELETELRKLIAPRAFWTVSTARVNDAALLIVDVPAGRDGPYSSRGRIYIRDGARTLEGTPASIRELVEAGYSGTERWERQRLPGAGMDRLNVDLIRDIGKTGQEKRNFPFTDIRRPQKTLSDLGLFRQGAITNAAEVLFGVRPAIQFPQIRSRVTVYAAHKGSDFIDSRVFEGPLLEMLEQMLSMVKRHTPVASLFRGGLRRSDRPAYPEEAVREGLVNAFAHRDYADFSGGVSMDLYPEKLVIWNSGSLPPGIKVGDLKREHPSMPRNPDIVQVLWLRGYMERVGRGTQNIVAWCTEAGLPVPSWRSDAAGVVLTFKYARKTGADDLNRRQKELLSNLEVGESIRLSAYQDRYMISERQGRRDIKELVEAGYLNREGNGPATVFIRLDKPLNPAKPGHN
ncbi:MAG TPA: ATP-binding protein [Candidatus Sabulitectum sp.]|nr:ATP-binding protein [Candidatus Sabulitectum sp.]HPF32188.1 ATP-binding protein [Candidatus Sabulitectum sp.]HPJ29066.1 ATP-binding protein [Candidatus Sabulitectum sp.]HPR22868.1 ATP-binding protein [Candidatus Sabulitectum sp.]